MTSIICPVAGSRFCQRWVTGLKNCDRLRIAPFLCPSPVGGFVAIFGSFRLGDLIVLKTSDLPPYYIGLAGPLQGPGAFFHAGKRKILPFFPVWGMETLEINHGFGIISG